MAERSTRVTREMRAVWLTAGKALEHLPHVPKSWQSGLSNRRSNFYTERCSSGLLLLVLGSDNRGSETNFKNQESPTCDAIAPLRLLRARSLFTLTWAFSDFLILRFSSLHSSNSASFSLSNNGCHPVTI
jgi:hypothetical protein